MSGRPNDRLMLSALVTITYLPIPEKTEAAYHKIRICVVFMACLELLGSGAWTFFATSPVWEVALSAIILMKSELYIQVNLRGVIDINMEHEVSNLP